MNLMIYLDEGTSESDSSNDPRDAFVAKLLRRVRENIGDGWRQDDHLLEKFFPVQPTWESTVNAVRKSNYHASRSRWKRIPQRPASALLLYTPIRLLMNTILLASPKKKHSSRKDILIRREDPRRKNHPRLFLDTFSRNKKVHSIPSSPISPIIFLAGAGCEFASATAKIPQPTTQSGISPIEVILNAENPLLARDRLAVNIYQMFYNQANRRFAYGLIITETLCTVYMFDHSGAVAGPSFNYHQQPAQFCAVVWGLGSEKSELIGFDGSIFAGVQGPQIRTWEPLKGRLMKETHYIITQGLFQFPTLVGRGTICWLTSKVDNPESRFVVKDAWIAPEELAGRESEGSLLHHVKSKGIVSGVVQLHHFEQVRSGEDPADLDTVLHNRQVHQASLEERKLDRIHTRIVMKTHGKTLDRFTSRKELILAFYDAVTAHRKIHDVAGILHRDISVRNILINPDGEEGDRGILIDFDHAIRVGDTSPYSSKTRILSILSLPPIVKTSVTYLSGFQGTWRFMSRNVLEAEGPHTYLDDLESFYFVFCWIVVLYEGPGRIKAVIPEQASYWDKLNSATLKRGHFAFNTLRLPLDPWFGSNLHDLALRLFRFFQARRPLLGKPLSDLNPQTDYDEFLSHIRQCIVDMGIEDSTSLSHLPSIQ